MNTETDVPPLSAENLQSMLPKDEQLRGLAIHFMTHARQNLDWTKVDPQTHWERLVSVFRGQAQMAKTFPGMVEGVRRALQIDMWGMSASRWISLAGRVLVDRKEFGRFQRLITEECSYFAAEVRAESDARRVERQVKYDE